MWEYETDGEKHDMFMDIDEEIRFRVVEEVFVDTSPTSCELVAGYVFIAYRAAFQCTERGILSTAIRLVPLVQFQLFYHFLKA